MSAIPCPIVLNECPGADSPVLNHSSEAPDPFMYAGIGYNPYDTHGVPPLGDGPDPKFDCSTIDWSTISQEMANFIAAATAAGCTVPPWPPIPGVPPFPNPPEIDDGGITPSPPAPFNTNEDLQQFTNDAQTVTLTCPNGSTFSQTIEAGAIYSPLMDPAVGPSWVAYINAWIYSYLLSVALADQACMTIPNVTERCAPQPIPCDWPAGCPWPPTDASCWPPGWIWPDIPGCPNPPTDPACFPPDTDWTQKGNHPHPPTTPSTILSNWPGWLCLGQTIDPASQTYEVTGTSNWVFAITGGVEPPGTSLVQTGPRTAVLTGTPTAPGYYVWDVTATSGTKSVFTIDAMHVLGIVMPFLPDGAVDGFYSEALTAAGGDAPYTFALESGSLPDGLSLSTDGTISGTPTTDEVASFTVKFTDANSRSCTQALTLNIDAVSCELDYVPLADVGVHYISGLTAEWIFFATPPVVFTLHSGELPPGITLASDGTLEGDPTTAGTYNFTVQVQDAGTVNCLASLTITVEDEPFSCEGVTENINDVVWSFSALHDATGSLSAGAGIFDCTIYWIDPGFGSSAAAHFTGQICNPTTSPIVHTMTVPWQGDGNILNQDPKTASFSIYLDGVQVDQVSQDLLAGPFTAVLHFTLPPEHVSTVEIWCTITASAALAPGYAEIYSNPTFSLT